MAQPDIRPAATIKSSRWRYAKADVCGSYMLRDFLQSCRVSLPFVLLLLFAPISCSPAVASKQPAIQVSPTKTTRSTPAISDSISPSSTPLPEKPATLSPGGAREKVSPSPYLPPIESAQRAIPPTAETSEESDEPSVLSSKSKYQISAQIDYASHRITASQSVSYVNRSPAGMNELLFVIEADRHSPDFWLSRLEWADGTAIEEFTISEAQLRVPLPSILPPDESISLLLDFEMSIPDQPGPLGYDERQTNFGDWYPYIPPYDPEKGWLVHEPGTVGEHLVYNSADFEVRIDLAEYDDDLVVAASAPAVQNGRWQEFKLDSARTFALSISPGFQVTTATINSVVVSSYYYPENRLAGLEALQTAADAMQLFSNQFTEYPHAGLSIVEAGFHDGMEYDGLVFLDQNLYTNYIGNEEGYLTAIVAHETAHQWWYGIVANDQALEPWLDEALATYSELLFYEANHPQSVDWWWDIRVLRFEPDGNLGDTIYDHDEFHSYVDTIYLNGALFIDEIRNSLGNADFHDLLQEYLSAHRHQLAGADDFWAILRAYDSENAGFLKQKYFYE